MPQSFSQPNAVIDSTGKAAPFRLADSGSILVSGRSCKNAALGLSAVTQVKVGKGHIMRVSVTTAGSSPGSVNDSATLAGAGAPNLLAMVPNAVGQYVIELPYFTGLVFTPGTGMVATVGYN